MGLLRTEYFNACLSKQVDIEKVCLAEKAYIDEKYNTLSSRKSAYSAYKKSLLNNNFSDEVKKIVGSTLKLTSDRDIDEESRKQGVISEYAQYREDYARKVKLEQDTLKTIYDVDGLIAKAESLIIENKFINQVLGFAAVTGRRVAEIGCTASFTLSLDNHLVFQGQLKNKGSKYIVDNYKIPCLINNIKCYKYFKQFRENFPKYLNNPEKFHSVCSKDLGTYVKKHFSEFVEGHLTPKDLRAIYATIACNRFKTRKKTNQSYIADILGHSPFDLNTCNSYFDYEIESHK